MRKGLQWRLSIVTGMLVAALLIGLAFKTSALRAMGHLLTIDEVAQKAADIIVVPEWAGKAGALEAADLVNAGISQHVAVMGEAPTLPELELARRHVPYESDLNSLIRLLEGLGVTDVIRLTESANGTEAEGRLLPAFCSENGLHSVVVVSTADHSRRIRRVIRRSMREAGVTTQVVVKSAPFSPFAPDAWWQTRAGTRTEIIELEKLALDVLRHPIS